MELLAWAVNIKSGIELSHYFLVPVTVEVHDVLQVHVLTSLHCLSGYLNIQLYQVIPIHRLNLSGRMSLGHDYRLIPVSVKPHPKPKVSLLLLLIAMIVLEPQVLKLVFALAIVDYPVPIELCWSLVHWLSYSDDPVLEIAQVIVISMSTGNGGTLHAWSIMSIWKRPATALCRLRHLGCHSLLLGMSTGWSRISSLLGIGGNR